MAMVMSSIVAGAMAGSMTGSVAGVWTLLSAMVMMAPSDGRASETAPPIAQTTAAVQATAAESVPPSEPCLHGDDAAPHQAEVMGCAHARNARIAPHGEAPPPPPFPGSLNALAGGGSGSGAALVGEDTDVLHYFLDLTITHSPANLTGVNTITVKALQNGVSTLGIQLHQNFTISSMTIGGSPVTWNRLDVANLNVTLDRAYNANETFDLVVSYTGTPVSGGFGSINFTTHSSQPLVFTLSEPFYAYTWWPVKEDNRDKATGDMWYNVPNTMKVAANGLLQGVDVMPGNRLRYRWKTEYQTTPYLFAFSATNYIEFTDTWNIPGGGTMLMQFFIYPELDTTNNRNGWLATKNMLTTFSNLYGVYPFADEKYGIYNFGFGGGMEHQTMTGQGGFTESLTAHELGHQWWGDMVTCANFHHIWLNEGFATYSEALWLEFKAGSTGTPALLSAMASRRPSSTAAVVYRADISSASIIFNSDAVYRKGAWVVHMLRKIMGDAAFFAAVNQYGQTYVYGTAVTEDLQAICEQHYGSSLEWFFEPWVYSPGQPTYQYNWRNISAGGQNYIELYLKQNQNVAWPTCPGGPCPNDNAYKMPIDIRTTINAVQGFNTVWNDAREEHLLYAVSGPATALAVDPNNYVLHPTIGAPITFVEGPPKVVKVTPAPGSSSDSGDVASIDIVFHKNVNAAAGHFSITGTSVGAVPFTFAYNAGTMTATLTPTAPLAPDTYAIGVNAALTDVAGSKMLDGEVANPNLASSLPSGDGLQGGNFSVNIIIEGQLCLGNANGDGNVNIDDLVAVITNWGWTGTPGSNPADVNGSGNVNIDDLVMVITNWGACP